MAESNPPPKEMVELGYERRDLSPKALGLFFAALAVTLVVAFFVAWLMMSNFYGVEREAQPPPSPLFYNPPPIAGPTLEVNPGQEVTALRAKENQVLDEYTWVDKEKGTVRIPIERAMEILAQKGLPVRAQKDDNAAKAESKNRREKQNGTASSK